MVDMLGNKGMWQEWQIRGEWENDASGDKVKMSVN
jgi:hypothetical protein